MTEKKLRRFSSSHREIAPITLQELVTDGFERRESVLHVRVDEKSVRCRYYEKPGVDDCWLEEPPGAGEAE